MVLGKSRQAHQRTQSFLYAKWYWVNHCRLTSEQSCTRTLDRLNHGRLTSEQSCTRTLDRLWTRRRVGLREMVLGKSRQAHQRTQSLPSATHRHSSITRPCCSSAQAPSFLSFTRRRVRDASEQSCTRTLDRLWTRRSVYAKWYWVNHGRLTSERKASSTRNGTG